MSDDYYAILGVSPTATAAEIKTRFRFLSQAYHPDKFKTDDHRRSAEEEFKRINAAYQVLSDPVKRARFDTVRPHSAVHPSSPEPPPQRAKPEYQPPQSARIKQNIVGVLCYAGILIGLFALVVAIIFLGFCSQTRPLTVGSKNFTEQVILGEIVAQHLERRLGQKVDRKLNLGGTLLTHQALTNGQIDLYPEYTGTALTTILKLPPSSDAAAVLTQVREEYRQRWKIEWLDPLGFNNTFAMAIRGDQARRENLETLSDAARRPQGWTLGMGYEFQQRPDGLLGLLQTYSLKMRQQPKSMDLGLLYKAIEQGQVDLISANATDGMLSVMDLKVLRDDKGYFPPYQAAILVRTESLDRYANLRAALQELSGKLPDQTMQKLNYQVDGKKRQVAEVAKEFLLSVPNRDR